LWAFSAAFAVILTLLSAYCFVEVAHFNLSLMINIISDAESLNVLWVTALLATIFAVFMTYGIGTRHCAEPTAEEWIAVFKKIVLYMNPLSPVGLALYGILSATHLFYKGLK
jgi:TRAP-type C4-dicarboxylate transport system permease small subunit